MIVFLFFSFLLPLLPSLFLFFLFSFVNVTLLFLTTASRTAILGEGAVLFLRPFEARAGDPVRKELFRQQAAGHYSSSPWFPPSAVPHVAPPALPPCLQASSGPVPSRLKGRRRRR